MKHLKLTFVTFVTILLTINLSAQQPQAKPASVKSTQG